MKKLTGSILVLLIVLFANSLMSNALAQSTEEVLEKYAGCTEISSEMNMAGVFVDNVDYAGVMSCYIVDVQFTNPILNQSKQNISTLFSNFRVMDANDPDTEVPFQVWEGHSNLTNTYYCSLLIDIHTAARFVIIYFNGIQKNEIQGCETPSLFFIVELDENASAVLTETPFTSGDLFK